MILDANFLFVPFQFRVDIWAELTVLLGRFEPVVLSTTVDELEALSKRGPEKTRKIALSALELVKKCSLLSVQRRPEESPDDVIVRVAKELQCPVATNDRALRKRLREAGIATIFLRQRSHLKTEGYL